MQQKLTEIVRIATLAGEILLKNGAETFRVEDTMERVAKACGAYRVDTFVTPTGVFISIRQENGKTLTGLKRINKRRNRLDRIAKVNEVSRALVEGRVDYQTALEQLRQIAKAKNTFSWLTAILASGVVGSGTAVIQNGGIGEVLVAFLAAALVRSIAHLIVRLNGVPFVFEFLGGATTALLGVWACKFYPQLYLDAIIVGGIMPMVPGVAITNSLRDLMAGFLLTGVARGMEAMVTTAAVAMGVMIVLAGLG